MKLIQSALYSITVFLLACATFNVSSGPPKDDREDPRLVSLINEYKELAEIMNIKFKNKIGVSLTKIDDAGTVGLCYHMIGYRQVQIDSTYWDNASKIKRLATLFHELTHCYCGRTHDYDGVSYPKTSEKKNKDANPEAYFEDGCPKSLMYPWVASEECVMTHYGEYISEMFKNCNPY